MPCQGLVLDQRRVDYGVNFVLEVRMQISGKYNTATVFAKELDPTTQAQIESMMNNPPSRA